MTSIVSNVKFARVTEFLQVQGDVYRLNVIPNGYLKVIMTPTAKMGFSFQKDKILKSLCDEMV